ncbi:MAG: hypothetical protein ACLUEJ_13010 [Clostridium sp.]
MKETIIEIFRICASSHGHRLMPGPYRPAEPVRPVENEAETVMETAAAAGDTQGETVTEGGDSLTSPASPTNGRTKADPERTSGLDRGF